MQISLEIESMDPLRGRLTSSATPAPAEFRGWLELLGRLSSLLDSGAPPGDDGGELDAR